MACFFHIERGYWETIGEPDDETRAAYPDGTVEVPQKPGPDHEWDGEAWLPVAPVISAGQVNEERDRRVFAGFAFKGHVFQGDPESLININGAVSAALAAQMAGAGPDEANWFSGQPFEWLAADNTSVPMTPSEVVAFGLAAAAHKASHIHAARRLKDTAPIPVDFSADVHWPVTPE